MQVKTSIKALLGVAALAAAASAHATSIDQTDGGVAFTLYDTSTGYSYVYDTGLTTATFNGGTNYSYDLSGDANLTAFLRAAGSDPLQFDVIAAGTVNTVYSTVSGTVGTPHNSDISHAKVTGTTYTAAVNAFATTTTNSAYVNVLADPAAFGGNEAQWVTNLKSTDVGTPNTPLAFYSFTINGDARSQTVAATQVQFAGLWNFNTATDVLTYGTPVPIPAPLGLLIGGLGLTSLIRRRSKADSADFSGALAV